MICTRSRPSPAEGVRGGGSGSCANQFRKDPDGGLHQLDPCAQAIIPEGHTIVSYSCGGGGYGSPIDRDMYEVAKDLKEKWISNETAEKIYGVIVNQNGDVDVSATSLKRNELKNETP